MFALLAQSNGGGGGSLNIHEPDENETQEDLSRLTSWITKAMEWLPTGAYDDSVPLGSQDGQGFMPLFNPLAHVGDARRRPAMRILSPYEQNALELAMAEVTTARNLAAERAKLFEMTQRRAEKEAKSTAPRQKNLSQFVREEHRQRRSAVLVAQQAAADAAAAQAEAAAAATEADVVAMAAAHKEAVRAPTLYWLWGGGTDNRAREGRAQPDGASGHKTAAGGAEAPDAAALRTPSTRRLAASGSTHAATAPQLLRRVPMRADAVALSDSRGRGWKAAFRSAQLFEQPEANEAVFGRATSILTPFSARSSGGVPAEDSRATPPSTRRARRAEQATGPTLSTDGGGGDADALVSAGPPSGVSNSSSSRRRDPSPAPAVPRMTPQTASPRATADELRERARDPFFTPSPRAYFSRLTPRGSPRSEPRTPRSPRATPRSPPPSELRSTRGSSGGASAARKKRGA